MLAGALAAPWKFTLCTLPPKVHVTVPVRAMATKLGVKVSDVAPATTVAVSGSVPVLERDPDQALESISKVLPSIDMPGHTMPGFREMADAIRRSGIYGPRDYLRIVQEQIRYWKIEALEGLGELGRQAQERILAIPERLKRVADAIESRSKRKTFSFDVVFNREFALE